MNMMVIVWVGLGVLIFALSFILPKRKEELDEDTKKYAGEQIRDILNKEVAGIQSRLDDVVSETIEESSSQTERALEKLTNEKIMAINEYSDTVIEDINVNHKEVLFLYDMLNDKHVTIRNTVTEVENTMGEVAQTAKDIEISAKEAAKRAKDSEEIAERAVGVTNLAEKAAQRTAQSMEMDVRHIVEDMIRGRVEETMEKIALPMIQERVDAILEDATLLMEQKPKILIRNEQETEEAGSEEVVEEIANETVEEEAAKEEVIEEATEEKAIEEKESIQEEADGTEPEAEFVAGIAQNAPQIVIEGADENNLPYYVVQPEKTESGESASEPDDEPEPEKITRADTESDEIRELERVVALEVLQKVPKETEPEELEEPEKPDELQEDVSGVSRTNDNQPEENSSEEISEIPERIEPDSEPKQPEAVTEPAEDFAKPETVSSWMQEDIFGRDDQNKAGRNNNEKILELHRAGMSDLAIARELRLGVGEVKLVIDLFKGM